MATWSVVRKREPERATFFVVRQICATSLTETVTVLHHVPSGASELASFPDANGALDFAEAAVRALRDSGSEIELVDPPYGLVGTG